MLHTQVETDGTDISDHAAHPTKIRILMTTWIHLIQENAFIRKISRPRTVHSFFIRTFAMYLFLSVGIMSEKITIKDIAEKANVSVGTVDRVLHNRSNVSQLAKEKVKKALISLNYHPNVYASTLAYNKSYTFYLLMPLHESEAYWQEIEQGVDKAIDSLRDFNIDVEIMHYKRFDNTSFIDQYEECLRQEPSGVIIVPVDIEVTRVFTDILHERNIPFILLDSYMPDLKPLSFWGQDSFSSGYFAARMLMLIASGEKQIMQLKQVKGGRVTSKQQANREVGFKHYMKDHFPSIEIIELQLPFNGTRKEYDTILTDFFAHHPHIHHCITFNSKAHIVGNYLLRHNMRNIQIMGYDMVAKNAECLRQGSISFLIAQHGYQQGFNCIDTLFKAVVLKKKVQPVNYMPIELLTKENVDFYRRTQL